MRALPTRHDLLRSRIDRFTRMLQGVALRDVKAVHRTRVASRRLRELLPVLELDPSTASKLGRRLRKVTQRLGSVREADVLLLLIDELHESGRYHEPALQRVREAAIQARDEVRGRLPGKTAAQELRRIAKKLERVTDELEGADTSQVRRAWRWALDARVSRRTTALKNAIDEAGAVYLPERLHIVRIAVKKLRYAVELVAEAAGTKNIPDPSTGSWPSRATSRDDLRMLKRTQELLGRLHDLQILIDRVRQVQASLVLADVTGWRDLDTLVTSLEQSCRRLHARYVGERAALMEICERLGGRRAAASRAARRAS